MKKKVKKSECCKHLDPAVLMLLTFVVILLLAIFALQMNLPLASFMMVK